MPAHLFTTEFTEYVKLSVEIHCSERKILFKTLPLTDKALAYNDIHVVFMPVNPVPLLETVDLT